MENHLIHAEGIAMIFKTSERESVYHYNQGFILAENFIWGGRGRGTFMYSIPIIHF